MPTARLIPEADKQSRLTALLARPLEERRREYKYRFAQSIVFGVPVIALQRWGGALGPVDSARWSSLLQAVLCGWVLYVNVGMVFEGLLVPRLRLRGDFLVGAVAVALYLYSLTSAIYAIVTSHLLYSVLFHLCIILLAAWSGWRWWRLRNRITASPPPSPLRSA
jgi:hypothetical protein